jgi:hypothetical protein
MNTDNESNADKNEPKSFTGLSGMLRTSPWLASEDLVGLGDVPAEIEDVLVYDSVAFDRGRQEKNVPAIKFRGKAKQLVLRTSANRRALVKMFGADTREWRGKTVYLYHDPSVKFGGKNVGGIRIKEIQS